MKEKKHNVPPHSPDWKAAEKFEKSQTFVAQTLRHVFDRNFGKEPPVDGTPPQTSTEHPPSGYENISCFHIRMKKQPTEYSGEDHNHASDSG